MTTTVAATSYGGSEALSVLDEPLPEPGPGQVRVGVRAIGINPFDHKVASGMMGSDPSKLPLRLGSEAVGVIEAVGPDVGGVAVGDEVIAFSVGGSYTSDLLATAAQLTPKPASVAWPQAAGLMATGVTAWHVLETSGVGAGDTVLVHGGAGGVGQMLLQVARTRGINVVATASASNHELIADLGATPISYGEGLLDRARAAAPGYAAAFDLVGTDEAIDTSLALLPAEKVISIAAFGRAADGIQLLAGQGPEKVIRDAARAPLAQLAADGDLVVRVDRTFPLAQAGAALDYLRTGHASGKVVLIP